MMCIKGYLSMKYQVTDLGKPQKKVLLLMAGPLKGGGGGKWPAVKNFKVGG